MYFFAPSHIYSKSDRLSSGVPTYARPLDLHVNTYVLRLSHLDGDDRKLICDFLLVSSTNLFPILHRFQVMADYWSNFR